MFYNYKLTWNDNLYVYVGLTTKPKRRLIQHRISCLSKKPKNQKLANVWLKYGEPTMTIMGQFETVEEMVEHEQFLIDQIWGEPICLNLNPVSGKTPDPTGSKLTEEHKAKISASMKGNRNTLGKTRSKKRTEEERKERLRLYKKAYYERRKAEK